VDRHKLKKAARELVEWAEARGWVLEEKPDGRNHWIITYPPTGGRVRIAGTPGEYRSTINTMAQIKRRERQGSS